MKRFVVFCGVILMWGFSSLAAPSLKGELIFPAQSKHVHSSSVVELSNGDLMTCWFSGSGERSANDVIVQGARLKKGAAKWSPVFVMADTPNLPDCNPVLFVDAKDRLWMFWIAVRANRWEHSILKYRRAEGHLRSGAPKWSWQDIIILEPGEHFPDLIKKGFEALNYDEPMWAEYAPQYTKMIIEAARDKEKRQSGWMPRTHPITLPSGRILIPLYSDGFNVSLMAISDDGGETWRAGQPIVGLGPIQPTVVRKKDGTLTAYMRDSGIDPSRVLTATSKDDGETWSPATDTDIPNPGSSLEVIALAGGEWVMILNDTENGRHRLALALSEDEGASWKYQRYLEKAESGQGLSFGYPSIIQARDGLLHATYSHHTPNGRSIKHVALSADWIRQPGE